MTWVQAALDGTTPGQFLLLECLTGDDLPVEPYAQAALDPDGWGLEVASSHYLPGGPWPLDEVYLANAGWHCPGARTRNWWQTDVSLDAAAGLLVDALWFGRGVSDPDRYAISVGTFPCEGGPARHDQAGTLVTA